MLTNLKLGAYSAQITMRLVLGDESIKITHMGPDYLLIDSARDLPPGEAWIKMTVDENLSEWKVRLPYGISSKSRRVTLAVCD